VRTSEFEISIKKACSRLYSRWELESRGVLRADYTATCH